MLELTDNDFKVAIIIILNEVKQNMFLIKENLSKYKIIISFFSPYPVEF